MKELFFQKRQNTEQKQENFIWRSVPRNTTSSYPDDCVPCKKNKPTNETGACGGKLHPCVSKEQNEHANWTAKNLKSLSTEIMSDKNHAAVRLNSQNAKDGLGAVVLGLMKELGIKGCLNYGLPVLYRSGKLTTQRRASWMAKKGNCFPIPGDMPPELRSPNVGEGTETQLKNEKAFRLSGVNAIYPGQLVTLVKENGKLIVIVSDTDPYDPGTVTVTPGGGGKRKKKKEKPCVDCDDNLRENLFGVGSLDERIEGTMTASKIFGDELDKYQRNFDALRGYNGAIKMIQKVLMPVFSGGVLGWSADAVDGKRNDMVKELTKTRKGQPPLLTEAQANVFVDKIVASMNASIPQAKAVAENVIAHYEESGFKQKNKDMLRRDISTYVMGTLIGGGLLAAGVITAPMISVLTASIVLSNVRLPFVKKLCVLPDVNTTMKALAAAKGWDQMSNYVDGSYTEQVKRTVKAGDVYMEQVQNFMKFENAILGGNDRSTKLTKTLTPAQRAEYQKKQDHIDRMLPAHVQHLGKLGVAIDGQGNFAVDQAKWAKKEFFTFISFDKKKGTTRRGIQVLMDKRSSTDKGRESRQGVPENEDKIKALNEVISNLVAEYNQDYKGKDKYGSSRIEVTGTPPRTQIKAYENGNTLIADNANFTAGRKKLQDRQGRLSAIRELHEVGTEMYEFNRLLRKGEEYRNYLETDDNSYGGTENVAENVYQVAVAGFMTEYTSYAAFAKNGTISMLMDHYKFDNAPAGQATPRQLLQEYYTLRLGDKRRVAIMNELVGRPKFRDFMKCLALMVQKCRETNCWTKWNKDLDKNSQAYVDGMKLYIDAVGPEKRRIAITWGMVEGLWKMFKSTTNETAVFEDRVRYTDTRKDGGVLNENVPIGSDYDQSMQWAMNNNPNIARELYQVQTGTVTNTVSQAGEGAASLVGGIVGPGLGAPIDNAIGNNQDNTKRK